MVAIDYTNHNGRRRWRKIEPLRIYRASNEWHPEVQWLLEAIDIDDPLQNVKSFALAGIHEWRDLGVTPDHGIRPEHA